MNEKIQISKNVNKAFVGALGSALLTALLVFLVNVINNLPGEPAPGKVVVISIVLLVLLSAMVFWLSGLVWIVRVLIRSPSQIKNWKIITGVVLIIVSPVVMFFR